VDEPYAFILYSFVLGFAVPLALISTFYYLVIKKLKSLRSKTKSKERKRSHRKVTKLVLIIIAMYVCFWTPHWILQIYTITLPPEHCKTKVEIVIFMLFGCLVYLNSSLNPLLYAFLSDSFKKHFVKACTCTNKKDFLIFQTESPMPSRFSKTRSSDKRHYSSVLMRINKNENRYHRKRETASAAATDESKEIILISTNINRKEVLQTDL
jgi:allatostatin C receptor